MNIGRKTICAVPLMLALGACSTTRRVEQSMDTQRNDTEVRSFLDHYMHTLDNREE